MPSNGKDIVCIDTKIVYQNRWMKIREDSIQRRSGTTGIFGVVEKSDFVVIAPIDRDKIYLVEQYRYPVEGRYWELPQGSWEDKPDTDPLDLARAELREETGLIADNMVYVGHLYLAYGYSNQGYHIYLATQLRAFEKQNDPEEEDMIMRSFSLDEVNQMISKGEIKDATTVAALGLIRQKKLLD